MSPARKPSKSAKKSAKSTAVSGATTRSPITPDAMSAEVIEFITAIDEYKRLNQRPFPNWSEILEIVKALGYERED